MMTLPHQVLRAINLLKDHLSKFDWSGQTAGRRALLEAFLRLASSQGFAAVTMRSLGKEVNLKGPSIYAHFPNGRDEIVAEALRWYYHSFGVRALEMFNNCSTVHEYWDALVRLHLTRQLERPESDLWDIVVATDRIGGFLQPSIRQEVEHWLELCLGLYESAAREMGYQQVERKIRIIMTLLNGATSWCAWQGDKKGLSASADQAVIMTRAILELKDIEDQTTGRKKNTSTNKKDVTTTKKRSSSRKVDLAEAGT